MYSLGGWHEEESTVSIPTFFVGREHVWWSVYSNRSFIWTLLRRRWMEIWVTWLIACTVRKNKKGQPATFMWTYKCKTERERERSRTYLPRFLTLYIEQGIFWINVIFSVALTSKLGESNPIPTTPQGRELRRGFQKLFFFLVYSRYVRQPNWCEIVNCDWHDAGSA